MSDWADRKERVLDVLERDQWLTRADVRRLARMDTAACGWVLHWLVSEGLIERTTHRVGRTGKPRTLYRLAMRRAA